MSDSYKIGKSIFPKQNIHSIDSVGDHMIVVTYTDGTERLMEYPDAVLRDAQFTDTLSYEELLSKFDHTETFTNVGKKVVVKQADNDVWYRNAIGHSFEVMPTISQTPKYGKYHKLTDRQFQYIKHFKPHLLNGIDNVGYLIVVDVDCEVLR